MAQAARAYNSSRTASTRLAPERKTSPSVRVIPGRRSQNPALSSVSSAAVSAFKIALAVLAVFAVVCCVRVMLTTATVDNLESISDLSSTIETAQSKGNELEIKHSVLSSPSRIEKLATDLGMSAPSKVTYMEVSLPSTTATNADGSISLAGTLANIESAASSSGN
ncbi:MAG: hypothetical protein ACOX69_06565 [Coriobacteriales bacterium]|jgi:cell division protein FtsL